MEESDIFVIPVLFAKNRVRSTHDIFIDIIVSVMNLVRFVFTNIDIIVSVMKLVKFVFTNELQPARQAKVTELSHKIHSTDN